MPIVLKYSFIKDKTVYWVLLDKVVKTVNKIDPQTDWTRVFKSKANSYENWSR